MDFNFLLDTYYLIILFKGLLMTIILALLSVVIGSILALLITILSISENKILNKISNLYIEIIRGTPLLVQVLLIYSFIKLPVILILSIDMSTFIPGMLALIINSSAYVSEIFRGGILSVDKGQKEAALSLGLSKNQTYMRIIFPQAFKTIIPSLGNEFVTMIKETSIFMYLGVSELMYSAVIIRSETYLVKETYIVIAALYFILTYPTSKLMKMLEKRLKRNE